MGQVFSCIERGDSKPPVRKKRSRTKGDSKSPVTARMDGKPSMKKGTKGEALLAEFFTSKSIPIETEYKIVVGHHNLRCDVYVPSLRMVIEFDGTQHYQFSERYHKTIEDFKRGQEYDRMKIQWALDNGLRIIHLDYSYVKREKMFSELERLYILKHRLILTSRTKYAYILGRPFVGLREDEIYVCG